MIDEKGQSNYSYDLLSQVTSESRYYNALSATFSRDYTYNSAGLLTGIIDPGDPNNLLGANYSYDKVGRLLTVNSGGYGQVNNIVTNRLYRSWGQIKQINYGNNTTSLAEYNNRQQVSKYELTKNSNNEKLMEITFSYTSNQSTSDNDGRLKKSTGFSSLDLTRNFSYDLDGRATSAGSGSVITSGSAQGLRDGPYDISSSYNAFGNLTNESRRVWYQSGPYITTAIYQENYEYVNNRPSQATFDADGRTIQSNYAVTTNFVYDVAGRLRSVQTPNVPGNSNPVQYEYDGDGNKTRLVDAQGNSTFYFYSTVLDEVIFELNGSGGFKIAYLFDSEGTLLAKEENNSTVFLENDPSGLSNREVSGAGSVTSSVETDPLGRITGPSYSGNNVNFNAASFYVPQDSSDRVFVPEWGVSMPRNFVETWNTANQRFNDFVNGYYERLKQETGKERNPSKIKAKSKPTLKKPPPRTKDQKQKAKKKADKKAATGIYDNEADPATIARYQEAVQKQAGELAAIVMAAPKSLRDLITNNSKDSQSKELIWCQAAIETGGAGWRKYTNVEQTQWQGLENNGDLGLMQIKLGTANDVLATAPFRDAIIRDLGGRTSLTTEEVRDYEGLNVALATWHLQTLINQFSSDRNTPYTGRGVVRAALAAYNGGRSNVLKYGLGKPQTQRATFYADRVLACERILQK